MTIQTNDKEKVNGILLLNKAQGFSSNVALQKAKRLYNAKKAGHTGSLDPLATGMLPVCFGEATKFCQYLLDDDKAYLATGLLGVKTNTGDALGEVIAQCSPFTVTEDSLRAAITNFIGPIMQVPSMFSALKFKGQPLYKLAREGITIERKARPIIIQDIKLLRFDGHHFAIEVHCSKGTYIRNLIEDIGEHLGVYAHVTQLHRLHTNNFSNQMMYSLEELAEMDKDSLQACLLPLQKAVEHLPFIAINGHEEISLRQGRVIEKQTGLTGCIQLYNAKEQFIGLGELDSLGKLKVKRLLSTDCD